MFYFRINKIKIFDNKTGKGFLGLGEDHATVQLWSLIVTGNFDLPSLDELMNTTDAERRKTLVAEAVQKVVASRRLTPIESVQDNMTATFGDTGYVLYQSKDMPDDFSWQFTAIKLNDKTRDIGAEMLNVVNHSDFNSFARNLPVMIGTAVNPAYTAGVEVARFVMTTVGTILKKKKDKQLGLLYMSLNRVEHYLHGLRDKADVPDLTNNMRVDYSIFAYDPDAVHQ